MTPRISVVMPVFNRERLVGETVESVLGQTCGDFELLAVDDCSTDGSRDVLARYARADGRVRLLHMPRNSRAAAARNLALAEARGEFVALLDSDDLAPPHWLTSLLAFMEAHPDVDVVGTWMETFGDHVTAKVLATPTDPDVIRTGLFFENTVNGATTLIRREFLVRHGLTFDPAFTHSEDYDLWERAAAAGARFAVQPEVLIRYRVHDGADTVSAAGRQREFADRVKRRQLERLLPSVTDREAALFLSTGWGAVCASAEELRLLDGLVARLVAANAASGRYPRAEFERRCATFMDQRYHGCRRTDFALGVFLASPARQNVRWRTRWKLVSRRLAGLVAGR